MAKPSHRPGFSSMLIPGASGLEGVAPTLIDEASLNKGTRCFFTGENKLKPAPLALRPSRLVVVASAGRPCCLLGEARLPPQASCWSRRRTTR
jgi:hypothetical protein